MSVSGGLMDFAATVGTALERIGASGRFGHRKVFVSAIWRSLEEGYRMHWTLADFKNRLFDAHRAQLLCLARADLVAAMERDMVADSEIVEAGVTFHFVVDATMRDPWS